MNWKYKIFVLLVLMVISYGLMWGFKNAFA